MEENGPGSSGNGWWPPDFLDKMESVSLSVQDEVLTAKESLSRNSSQVLWSTGTFSGVIPNGFYSLIPVSGCFCLKLPATRFASTIALRATPIKGFLIHCSVMEETINLVCH